MRRKLPRSFSSAPPKVSALVLSLALGLGGCAKLPALDQLGSVQPASSYQTGKSFAAPASAWPTERWWQGYGDPQLDTLINEALRDSPDMAAVVARLRRAAAFADSSHAALLPQVSAGASVSEQTLSYNYLTPRSATPSGWQDYGQATLSASWELDFWGKNRAGLAAATSQLEASRAEFAQVRLSLAADIAANYAELARLCTAREIAERSVAIRSKTVALFSERFQNGMETKGSLGEARSRLAVAQGDQLSLNEQIGLQQNRLAALAGAGPDRALAIKRPTVNLTGNFGLPAELASELLGRRPDIRAARLQVEAQLHRVEQKKAEFYPNVNLSGFIGLQSLGLDTLVRSGSVFGSIGPALSLPIFTAGRLQGELRQSAAGYNEAVAGYQGTLIHALEEVANAGLSMKSLAAQVEKGAEAVADSAEAHAIARNRYEGGLANYLEVLSAEDLLLTNQRNLAGLQSRAFSLDVALKRALGGGYHVDTI
jgi:NodT family efflux transporter outer membrane factor (OMF) lipoprotein